MFSRYIRGVRQQNIQYSTQGTSHKTSSILTNIQSFSSHCALKNSNENKTLANDVISPQHSLNRNTVTRLCTSVRNDQVNLQGKQPICKPCQLTPRQMCWLETSSRSRLGSCFNLVSAYNLAIQVDAQNIDRFITQTKSCK